MLLVFLAGVGAYELAPKKWRPAILAASAAVTVASIALLIADAAKESS